MADAHSLVRVNMLAEFRKSRGDAGWPTAKPNRTINELFAIADSIKQENARQAAQAAQKKRAERLAKIKADPKPFIKETEKLAAERSTDSYQRIGEILAELREALAGGKQADLAAKQAKKLHTAHPTLNRLKSALRKHGFEV